MAGLRQSIFHDTCREDKAVCYQKQKGEGAGEFNRAIVGELQGRSTHAENHIRERDQSVQLQLYERCTAVYHTETVIDLILGTRVLYLYSRTRALDL